jgi:hypothetical protein
MEIYNGGETAEGKIFLLHYSSIKLDIEANNILLNLCLKQLALLYNLDPTRITFHSLRVGGASALAAAGVPDYLIMDMGRWRSLTFLTYVRRCAQMFDVARNALLARRDLLTANQIKLMNPRATMVAMKS